MLSKNKSFRYKFLFGFGLFLITQIISYKMLYLDRIRELEEIAKRGINICVIHFYGFPFPINYGGDFIFIGIAINLIVSIAFVFIVCFLVKFVQSKISTWSNKLK